VTHPDNGRFTKGTSSAGRSSSDSAPSSSSTRSGC
jgi:hypothetical protein